METNWWGSLTREARLRIMRTAPTRESGGWRDEVRGEAPKNVIFAVSSATPVGVLDLLRKSGAYTSSGTRKVIDGVIRRNGRPATDWTLGHLASQTSLRG
jgi:hypothetical protein